jgi:hypothetical protein
MHYYKILRLGVSCFIIAALNNIPLKKICRNYPAGLKQAA